MMEIEGWRSSCGKYLTWHCNENKQMVGGLTNHKVFGGIVGFEFLFFGGLGYGIGAE